MAGRRPNNGGGKGFKQVVRYGLFWAIIIFVGLIIYASMNQSATLKEVAFSEVVRRANAGDISKLEIQGNDIKITPKDQDKPSEKSVKEGGSSIYEQGLNKDAKVEVKVVPPSTTNETLWNLAIIIVPVVIIVLFFMFIIRRFRCLHGRLSLQCGLW